MFFTHRNVPYSSHNSSKSEKQQSLHVLILSRIMITIACEEKQKSDNCLPQGKQESLKSFLSGSILPINYCLASALTSYTQVL